MDPDLQGFPRSGLRSLMNITKDCFFDIFHGDVLFRSIKAIDSFWPLSRSKIVDLRGSCWQKFPINVDPLCSTSTVHRATPGTSLGQILIPVPCCSAPNHEPAMVDMEFAHACLSLARRISLDRCLQSHHRGALDTPLSSDRTTPPTSSNPGHVKLFGTSVPM